MSIEEMLEDFHKLLCEEIERLRDKILKLETDVSIYKDLSNLRQEKINKANYFIDQEIMYLVKPKDYNKIEMLQDILNGNKFGSDKE